MAHVYPHLFLIPVYLWAPLKEERIHNIAKLSASSHFKIRVQIQKKKNLTASIQN